MSAKRKLFADLFTDMISFSALMQSDERRMRRLILEHRRIVVEKVRKYNGQVIQY